MTNSPIQHCTGIILSGGQSLRFQQQNDHWQDKALFKIAEQTLLEKIIYKFDKLCTEIIIVVNDLERKQKYHDFLSILPKNIYTKISIVTDDPSFLCSGPTLGLISGIMAASNNYILVNPVDMPNIPLEIYRKLLAGLTSSSFIVPFLPSIGKIEPLVLALDKEQILSVLKIFTFIKRSRADDIHRAISAITFLPFTTASTEVINNIFSSINQRTIPLNTTPEKEINVHDYSTGDFLSIYKTTKEDSFQEVISYLKKQAFIEPTLVDVQVFLEFVTKLHSGKNYFLTGLIISAFFDEIPINLMKSENWKNNKEALAQLAYNSYLFEAEFWGKHGLHFLEYHAYLDAQTILQFITTPKKEGMLKEKIIMLRRILHLGKKNRSNPTFEEVFSTKFPAFLKQAEKVITESEKQFNKESPNFATNFLWDHSLRVGKIAFYLANKEGVDPVIPTIGAILHDAGKFVLGRYHKDDVPEEEHSASIAETLLQNHDLSQETISEIITAITALYNDQLECNQYCKIVHDADRLEKLGALGIANFFTKSALRGISITESLIKHLSRELTYTRTSPNTLYTKTAQDLAHLWSNTTIDYFMTLLEEYKKFNLGRFFVKELSIADRTDILIVVPEFCTHCDGHYLISYHTEKEIKCEKLIINYKCDQCSHEYSTSFCLPIIIKQ